MKIGMLYDLTNPHPESVSIARHYEETLEHMVAMDNLGFTSLSVAEHHFQDNTTYTTSEFIWNAAAAVRTKRAIIGQYILIVPYAHPVRLAEDMATIDILSNGRLWFQAGEGYIHKEFEGFGIDRKRRASMTAEGMEIIRKCWTEDSFSYDGKHYHLKDVRMFPKPVQKPHPLMFLSQQLAHQPPMERAIRMGFHAATATIPPENWDNWYTGWVDTIRSVGKNPTDFQCCANLNVYVTDDPEREFAKHREGFIRVSEEAQRQRGVVPGGSFGTPERPRPTVPDNPFKTPDQAAAYIRRCYGKNPPTHLLLMSKRLSITTQESLGYQRMFMEKVMPQIKDLIK